MSLLRHQRSGNGDTEAFTVRQLVSNTRHELGRSQPTSPQAVTCCTGPWMLPQLGRAAGTDGWPRQDWGWRSPCTTGTGEQKPSQASSGLSFLQDWMIGMMQPRTPGLVFHLEKSTEHSSFIEIIFFLLKKTQAMLEPDIVLGERGDPWAAQPACCSLQPAAVCWGWTLGQGLGACGDGDRQTVSL